MQPILVYNRQSQSLEQERVYQQAQIAFLNETRRGQWLTEYLLKFRWFSVLNGYLRDRKASKQSIAKFIEYYDINTEEMSESPESYDCFNDFFIRKLKPSARPIDIENQVLISPADARLCAYPIEDSTVVPVKGCSFSIAELLCDKILAQQYYGGMCLIFRLAPVDYHRFCYIDSGQQGPVQTIPGYYRSVNPVSLLTMKPIYTENRREYCVCHTQHFNEVIHIDVGAMTVGKIVQEQPNGGTMTRGGEKGYFKFGGSTIVLLLKKDCVTMDTDILTQSLEGIETLVKMGERIGLRVA